jgi:hypothetical protein
MGWSSVKYVGFWIAAALAAGGCVVDDDDEDSTAASDDSDTGDGTCIQLGESCADAECCSQLGCDPSTNVCVEACTPAGENCQTGIDCCGGLACQDPGICAECNALGDGCSELSLCCGGLVCDLEAGESSTCVPQ